MREFQSILGTTHGFLGHRWELHLQSDTAVYWENSCAFAIIVLKLDLFSIFNLKQPMKVEHDHIWKTWFSHWKRRCPVPWLSQTEPSFFCRWFVPLSHVLKSKPCQVTVCISREADTQHSWRIMVPCGTMRHCSLYPPYYRGGIILPVIEVAYLEWNWYKACLTEKGSKAGSRQNQAGWYPMFVAICQVCQVQVALLKHPRVLHHPHVCWASVRFPCPLFSVHFRSFSCCLMGNVPFFGRGWMSDPWNPQLFVDWYPSVYCGMVG